MRVLSKNELLQLAGGVASPHDDVTFWFGAFLAGTFASAFYDEVGVIGLFMSVLSGGKIISTICEKSNSCHNIEMKTGYDYF